MKQSITSSNSLEKKFVGRKDKEKMRQLRKKMEEEQKRKKQIQQAEMQLKRLKQTGLVAAYNQFLKSLVLNGLPPPSLLYEQAASYILKYEKKIKLNEQTKEKMEEFNKQILKKSRSQQKQKFSPRKKNKKNWDILIPQGIQKQKQ